jgi:tRNA threonylcarbamoyl adenosine modification protein YeaZ
LSSYNKQKSAIGHGTLTLCLNAAEGRLQLILGRYAPARHNVGPVGFPARPSGTAPHTQAIPQADASNITAPVEPEILAVQDWSAVSQGAELLATALQQILGNLQLQPDRIGRLAVVTGPGSFTGLRLVCSTAAAMSRALKTEQASLEYLPLLAASLVDTRPDLDGREIWVLTHARKGLVYAQGFARLESANLALPASGLNPADSSGSAAATQLAGSAGLFGLRELCELQVLDLPGVHKLLRERSGFLLGSGLSNNYQELAEAALSGGGKQWLLLPGALDQIRPAVLLRAGLAAPLTEQDLQPLYVRPSDAEENLGQIAAGLGLDGDFAKQRLADLLKE